MSLPVRFSLSRGDALCTLGLLLSLTPAGPGASGVLRTHAVGRERTATRYRSATRITALDRGGAVVPDVLVTAMAFGTGGIVYAGGYTLARNPNDFESGSPTIPHSPVILVSRNHGATWARYSWGATFTALSIAVDPRNPLVAYAAGCYYGNTDCGGAYTAPSRSKPIVLKTTTGGVTWQSALHYAVLQRRNGLPVRIDTNIRRTKAFVDAIGFGKVYPAATPGTVANVAYATAVAVDPTRPARVYACLWDAGVIRSDDGGESWTYAAQSGRFATAELLITPGNPRIVYALSHGGLLERSDNGSASWQVVHTFPKPTAASIINGLTLVGSTLYVTRDMGISASANHGVTWRAVTQGPQAGSFETSVHGRGTWISAFAPAQGAIHFGLYVSSDLQHWSLGADLRSRGLKHAGGALDGQVYSYGLTRLWLDPYTQIIYTASQFTGLYRWQS